MDLLFKLDLLLFDPDKIGFNESVDIGKLSTDRGMGNDISVGIKVNAKTL